MNYKNTAETIFNKIGDGHNNAVKRPSDKATDRYLRRLISEANSNGDVIISGKNGYYRPIPGNVVDDMEYRIYMAQEQHRIVSLREKNEKMRNAYMLRGMEVEECEK